MADTKPTATETATAPAEEKAYKTIAIPVPLELHAKLNKLRFKMEKERLTHLGLDALQEYADKYGV